MNKFKSEVTVTIDEDHDLGYIYFKSPWGSSEKQRHVKGDDNIILDFDAGGHIIGIETLCASEHIHPIMRARSKTLSEAVAEVRAMTDLERAAWAALKGDITSWPAQIVSALAAARREGAEEARAEFADAIRTALNIGAEEMRERAAQTAESDDWSDVYGWNPVALSIAKTIRALPLTPSKSSE